MSARGWIEALSRSVRERTSEFRWAEAGNQKIALPPVEEQKAIADFLDREVGRIERLVSKNDELVELAEQRHRSVISEALAVGLNPRAPLKESSLPWASKCPAHWDVKPLWAVAKQNKRSNKGMIEDNLLSLSYGRIVRRDIEAVDGLLPESFETYQVVLPGDVIFRLTDLQNDQKSLRSGVVLERGIITSAYLSIELSELLDPGFFGALMRSYDLRKVFYGMGSGLRQSLNWDEFKGMSVLVPSLEEQIQISKHLELLDAKHQKLKLRLKNLNMTLAQRKAALVDAAVTGKIKVREI
jgi:type I restriction enzyme S subunit